MIEHLVAWVLRRTYRPGRCRWCDITVSSGSPTYPFCSEQCREDDWQSTSVY